MSHERLCRLCAMRMMASTSAFQADRMGSIPIWRSSQPLPCWARKMEGGKQATYIKAARSHNPVESILGGRSACFLLGTLGIRKRLRHLPRQLDDNEKTLITAGLAA